MQSSTVDLKFKDFLRCGALLQRTPEVFNLFIGPFSAVQLNQVELNKAEDLLFQPDFWDFLDNTEGSHSFLKPKEILVFSKNQLLEMLSKQESKSILITWNKIAEEEFKKQFQWSIKNFDVNKMNKTVPVISASGESKFSEQNLVYVLKKILSDNNYGWTYGLWGHESGYLGHTPELLCDWNQSSSILKTSALAGTYLNNVGASKNILQDNKILNEHQIVVDDISEKLSQFHFLKQSMKVLELKHLVHLKTDFQLKVSHFLQAFEVLNRLHPTAALGIYPCHNEYFQQLKFLQLALERKNFAAPFAFVSQKEMLAVAAIRGFRFDKKQIQIFSGCGVTSQSKYENELFELKNKRESVMKMMGFVSEI